MAAKKTGILVGVLAAAGIAAAAFAGAGGLIPVLDRDVGLPLTQASMTTSIFQPPPGAPMSFADIFERVSPAVVSIDVKSDVPIGRGRGGLPEGIPPELLPFFGPQGPGGGGGGRGGRGGGEEGAPQTREAQSAGSGFFISRDGYIVTNNHVVENSREITVTLKDKRELKAEIVGRDEETDLAVLKVQGSNFPSVNFENSSKPRVGDWVITIGNPFGLGGTATAGIVSAYGRELDEDDSSAFVDFIQIDAPINRGNSGGPTFDIYGRVIGVNSAIYSPTGGSVGIGFAIPADVAESVTKALIAGGRVGRGYLGARIATLTSDYAEGLSGVPKDQKGVLITSVEPDGPGLAAGLQEGDIVLDVNGKAVAKDTELTRAVAATRTGDPIRLNVLREGRRVGLTVRSGTRPPRNELAEQGGGGGGRGGRGAQPAVPEEAKAPAVLGMRLGPIDEAARRTYNIPATVRGMVITEVVPRSDAAEKGVQPGFVIVRASGRAVTSIQDVEAAVAEAKRDRRPTVLLFIYVSGRGNQPVPINVE